MGISGIEKLNTGLSRKETPMSKLDREADNIDSEESMKKYLKQSYLAYHLAQKVGTEFEDSFMFLDKAQLIGVLNGLKKSNVLSSDEAEEIRLRLNNKNLPEDIKIKDVIRIKDLFINGVSNPDFIEKFDIFRYLPKSKLLQALALGLSLASCANPAMDKIEDLEKQTQEQQEKIDEMQESLERSNSLSINSISSNGQSFKENYAIDKFFFSVDLRDKNSHIETIKEVADYSYVYGFDKNGNLLNTSMGSFVVSDDGSLFIDFSVFDEYGQMDLIKSIESSFAVVNKWGERKKYKVELNIVNVWADSNKRNDTGYFRSSDTSSPTVWVSKVVITEFFSQGGFMVVEGSRNLQSESTEPSVFKIDISKPLDAPKEINERS